MTAAESAISRHSLIFLPLGADLLVELCKLLVDVCFFFCESLP